MGDWKEEMGWLETVGQLVCDGTSGMTDRRFGEVLLALVSEKDRVNQMVKTMG